jgi:hypothetical protein
VAGRTRSTASSPLSGSKRVRASHWLNPVDPTAYRNVTPNRGAPSTVDGAPRLVQAYTSSS